MFVLSNLVGAIASILHTIIWLYTWIIIISCVLSWVNPDPYNSIVRTLRALTEPVLWRVRRYLPFTYINNLDLSPIVVILVLQFLDMFIVNSLSQMARLL